MPVTVIVGTQWGDEGKGKIIDFMQHDFDAGCRFNGGCNAGHTVVAGGQKFSLHHLPSTLIQGNISILGNGMVIDPSVLISEIESLKSKGKRVTPENLKISSKAHIILDYHKAIDSIKGKHIGTTGRGIGPAYSDKAARTGIRFEDLQNPAYLKERLGTVIAEKNMLLKSLGHPEFSAEQVYSQCMAYSKTLSPFVCDTVDLVNSMLRQGKKILAEGAQAAMLDIDHGSYPYVTSSNTTSGAACTGLGIAPTHIKQIVGVAKAYCTRVGSGPLPTEDEELAKKIRDVGNEYGTTTGRPRRIGHPDWSLLRYTCMINGVSQLAVTKLDVLAGLDIKVAIGHQGDEPVYSKRTYRWPALSAEQSAKAVRDGFLGLPQGQKEFLLDMAKFVGVPISIASIGPDRELTVTKGVLQATGKAI